MADLEIFGILIQLRVQEYILKKKIEENLLKLKREQVKLLKN